VKHAVFIDLRLRWRIPELLGITFIDVARFFSLLTRDNLRN